MPGFRIFADSKKEEKSRYCFSTLDEETPEEVEEMTNVLEKIPYEDEFLKTMKIRLYDYQLDALRWMCTIVKEATIEKKRGGILADVMGLGKTIDGLSLISYESFLRQHEPQRKKLPTLIVASLTLVSNWMEEATKKFDVLESEIFLYHRNNRKAKFDDYVATNGYPTIVLTTYQTIQTEYKHQFKKGLKNMDSPLFTVPFKYVFLDEAHTVRNKNTKTSEALQAVQCMSLFCFTGTPIFNSTEDIITLSELCSPSEKLEKLSPTNAISRWKQKYMLRRQKDIIDIPPLQAEDVWLTMFPEEQARYQQLEMAAKQTCDALMNSDMHKNQYKRFLRVLVRLRQECDHTCLKLGFPITSKQVEKARKMYPGKNVMYDHVQEPTRINRELFFTEEEIADLMLMKPTKNEDGSTNFIISEEKINRRKQVMNKLKKQRHKEKKKRKQSTTTSHPAESLDSNESEESEEEIFGISLESATQKTTKKFKTDSGTVNMPYNYVDTSYYNDDGESSDSEENSRVEPDTSEGDIDAFDKMITTLTEQIKTDFEEMRIPRSAKIDYLIRDLIKMRETDALAKTVIISQFTTMLDLTEIALLEAGFTIVRLDGRQQKSELRKKIIDRFCQDPSVTVFLMSLKAGGEGLNLISATSLWLLDPWWNEALERQASDRIHRLGQTRSVSVKRLLIRPSIEEEVLEIQHRKSLIESDFYSDRSYLPVSTLTAYFNRNKFNKR